MWLRKCFAVLAAATVVAGAKIKPAIYKPSTWTKENETHIFSIKNEKFLNLSSDGIHPSIIILDYGKDVEGYPTFEVSRRHGDTSHFEISYSETRNLLDSYMVCLHRSSSISIPRPDIYI